MAKNLSENRDELKVKIACCGCQREALGIAIFT